MIQTELKIIRSGLLSVMIFFPGTALLADQLDIGAPPPINSDVETLNAAVRQGGTMQERIQALEAYKSAVSCLHQKWREALQAKVQGSHGNGRGDVNPNMPLALKKISDAHKCFRQTLAGLSEPGTSKEDAQGRSLRLNSLLQAIEDHRDRVRSIARELPRDNVGATPQKPAEIQRIEADAQALNSSLVGTGLEEKREAIEGFRQAMQKRLSRPQHHPAVPASAALKPNHDGEIPSKH